MTISYNLDVSSIKSWAFLRLIFRWKGSIWKSTIFEVSTWLISFYTLLIISKYFLNNDQFQTFTDFAKQCDEQLEWIPLTFMLGFFVSIVIGRWQSIFSHIGFIDDPALVLAVYLPGEDEKTKMHRRNIMRYLCLAQVLVLRDVSIPVRKRFPTFTHVQDAGYLNQEELELLERTDHIYSKYYIPINWCFAILAEQRAKEKIKTDLFLNVLLQEIRIFRGHLQALINYDWVPVPLIYPQVVYLAVRVYFAICVVSRQYVPQVGNERLAFIDTYFPFMTIMQLLFYFGWLKVAEVLLNPLGEDDEDLETNFIIDRNRAIAFSIVDEQYGVYPSQHEDPLIKSQLTQCESANGHIPALVGSASQLMLNELDDGTHVHRGSIFSNIRDQIHRKMSRTMSITPIESPPTKRQEGGWTHHHSRRPTLYVSEPTNMPTIRSIDEVFDDDVRSNPSPCSTQSTDRMSSPDEENTKDSLKLPTTDSQPKDVDKNEKKHD